MTTRLVSEREFLEQLSMAAQGGQDHPHQALGSLANIRDLIRDRVELLHRLNHNAGGLRPQRVGRWLR